MSLVGHQELAAETTGSQWFVGSGIHWFLFGPGEALVREGSGAYSIPKTARSHALCVPFTVT